MGEAPVLRAISKQTGNEETSLSEPANFRHHPNERRFPSPRHTKMIHIFTQALFPPSPPQYSPLSLEPSLRHRGDVIVGERIRHAERLAPALKEAAIAFSAPHGNTFYLVF